MVGEPQIVLEPGANIAIWPEVKLGRAYAHMMELQQRIEEWEALRPMRSTALQVGPAEVHVALEVSAPPPLEALATIFGDAIHNLRSALDAVTWEMATFGDQHPATARAEKAVQFPLYDDSAKFEEWLGRVGSIPEQLAARLELQQPYHRAADLAEAGQVDTILALHDLDILDKHRNSILSLANVADVATVNATLRGDARKLVLTPQDSTPLVGGTVLVKITSSEPFELLEYLGKPVTARFDVPYNYGRVPLLDLLATMSGKVRATLDSLYGEHVPPTDFDTSAVFDIVDGQAAPR
jgi:hypothetical protein